MAVRTYAEVLPPPEPEREVVLHMTEKQARILAGLLGRCSTGPQSELWNALQGVVGDSYPEYDRWDTSKPVLVYKES